MRHPRQVPLEFRFTAGSESDSDLREKAYRGIAHCGSSSLGPNRIGADALQGGRLAGRCTSL
jgi:hypothetical protein